MSEKLPNYKSNKIFFAIHFASTSNIFETPEPFVSVAVVSIGNPPVVPFKMFAIR